MMSVAELDALPPEQAAELLRSCCGAPRWVSSMVTQRPFRLRRHLVDAAVATWRSLAPEDWREAFRHHPRIGEQRGAIDQGEQGRKWSALEQAGMSDAMAAVRDQMAAANREYEHRFGFGYIVNAAGRSGAEMLELARLRMGNDPALELTVAAGEQQQIMQGRLERLFEADYDARGEA